MTEADAVRTSRDKSGSRQPLQDRRPCSRCWLERHGAAKLWVDAGLVWPLALLITALAMALPVTLSQPGSEETAFFGLMGLAAVGLGVFLRRFVTRLLQPLVLVRSELTRLCQGQSGGKPASDRLGVLGDMAVDIQSLSEELTGLYDDMDNRVTRQTARLAQKTASLKILYDVAASINQAWTLEELLLRFLRLLKEMINGKTAMVRLFNPDGSLRLVGSINLDNQVLREEQMLPIPLCRCGRVLVPGHILCELDTETCSRLNGRPMFGPDRIDHIRIPIEFQGRILGEYDVFVPKTGVAAREDIRELLATIGSHLGMAVAKQHSDAEARRLSLIEERTSLAHELHDSLAQTLAGLRFQVRMLEETLQQQGVAEHAMHELERLRTGLDEAHTELRELLTSFRAPVNERGLVPALEKLVQRFRSQTGIPTFFQRDCRQVDLTSAEELQVLRIVQESLNNVRKHAAAHTVRVLLRCRAPGQYLLLVEDDGVGFAAQNRQGRPGEHIGLSIMEERARRLRAELRIESEPGEGTRVELSFRANDRGVSSKSEG